MNDRDGVRLPDFIGIGPPRTGTTWLHQVLAGRVGMPRGIKELHFFDKQYARGFKWYANHFAQYPAQIKIGEITPDYFRSSEARERIAGDIPECRIICSLREPVARLYSFYKLMCHLGKITRFSFEQALEQDFRMTGDHRYTYNLKQWLKAFGRENVLICLYDQLESDPQAYLNNVTDFIGAPRIPLTSTRVGRARVHSIGGAPLRPRLARMMWQLQRTMDRERSHKIRKLLRYAGIWQYCFKDGAPFPPLDPELEARLKKRFSRDLENLEEMLALDLSAWKQSCSSPDLESKTEPLPRQ
jgi:hypothetical protein